MLRILRPESYMVQLHLSYVWVANPTIDDGDPNYCCIVLPYLQRMFCMGQLELLYVPMLSLLDYLQHTVLGGMLHTRSYHVHS